MIVKWFIPVLLVSMFLLPLIGCSKDVAPSPPASTPPAVETPSTPPTSTPSESNTPKPEANTYPSGMYKIGVDMPAGEYVVIKDAVDLPGFWAITKDSTGEGDVIATDVFDNRSIVTVKDGQYLKLSRCKAYPAKDAPK